jgi:EAL domain-containing protein (putative c-di-GMP-specific phosphodiesterase class I)
MQMYKTDNVTKSQAVNSQWQSYFDRNVVFSPLLDTHTNSLKGVEARLVPEFRNDALQTTSLPQTIKSPEEQLELEVEVIAFVFTHFSRWLNIFCPGLVLYLNLSEISLLSRGLPYVMCSMLSQYEIYPDSLVLNMEKWSLLEAQNWPQLARLRETGVSIAANNVCNRREAQMLSALSRQCEHNIVDALRLNVVSFFSCQNLSVLSHQDVEIENSIEIIGVEVTQREQLMCCRYTGIDVFQGDLASPPLPRDNFESWFLM